MKRLTLLLVILLLSSVSHADTKDVWLFGDSLTDGEKWLPWASPQMDLRAYATSGADCDEILDDVNTFISTYLGTEGYTMDVAVIQCGTNDLSGGGGSPATTLTEVQSIVSALQATGATVVVSSPPPMRSTGTPPPSAQGQQDLSDFADLLDAWTTANNILFANVHAAFMAYDAVSGQEMDDLFPDDDVIHPYVAGYALMGMTIGAELDKIQPRSAQVCQ